MNSIVPWHFFDHISFSFTSVEEQTRATPHAWLTTEVRTSRRGLISSITMALVRGHSCAKYGPTATRLDDNWQAWRQQVTRGHNIVADGWAGAYYPYPHPNPPPTLKLTQKVSKMLIFNSITMTDQRTNGQTDGWTKPLIELRVRN